MHIHRWCAPPTLLILTTVACTAREAAAPVLPVEPATIHLVGRLDAAPASAEKVERPIRFALENAGASALAFLDGDRSRNECGRDNHFEFEVRRDGLAQPIRTVIDFGGLSREVVLAPGGRHEFAIDLAHWTPCAEPGDYHVNAIYRGTMYPPETLGRRELECDVEVRAEFVLRVR